MLVIWQSAKLRILAMVFFIPLGALSFGKTTFLSLYLSFAKFKVLRKARG